jgi:signal transduction histidine kinase
VAAERTVLQVAIADPDPSVPALRQACEKALAWNEQQERLIDALLTLASTDREIERWETFDLARLADQSVLNLHQEAGRRNIRIDSALAPATASGDAALAESLIANLVSNAIRYNIDNGRIEIATAIEDGRAVLTVANTGAPIQASEVDRLFQPFQRRGADRVGQTGGHGLGLAIVTAIARIHGAAVIAAPGAEGGLTIKVTFPLTDPEVRAPDGSSARGVRAARAADEPARRPR